MHRTFVVFDKGHMEHRVYAVCLGKPKPHRCLTSESFYWKRPKYLCNDFLVPTVMESLFFGIEQHHVFRGVFCIPASGVSVLLLLLLCFAQIVLHLSNDLLYLVCIQSGRWNSRACLGCHGCKRVLALHEKSRGLSRTVLLELLTAQSTAGNNSSQLVWSAPT